MNELLRPFTPEKEARAAREEMLIGEIVRAMFRSGHPTISFSSDAGRRSVGFLALRHPVLHDVEIAVDPGTVGADDEDVTLEIAAGIETRHSDPEALLRWLGTDLPEPAGAGGIRLRRGPSRVVARSEVTVPLSDLTDRVDEGIRTVQELLDAALDRLAERLAELDRAP